MRPWLIATVSTFALLLAACSGKQAPSQPTTGSEPMPAHGSLAECLRANGVPESSGPAAVLGPPAGVDPAKWDKAMKACGSLAPGPAGP
ncbi:MAG: hypothetical protein KIH64_011210 [Mycobacterium sp.]|nr:hypothetical protein [Mycobacterium sp.]